MSSDLEGDLNQDGIIDEMDRLRGDLGGEIDELGDRVRTLFDWQAYIRKAPLASAGAALVIGYLLAPAIIPRRAPAPVTDRLKSMGSSAKSAGGGIASTLWSIAMAAATRAGSAYVSDLISREFMGSADSKTAHTPASESRSPF